MGDLQKKIFGQKNLTLVSLKPERATGKREKGVSWFAAPVLVLVLELTEVYNTNQ